MRKWRGIVVNLNVPDLDKIYDAAIKNNLTILLEPVEEYYGDKVFMFPDKDGYEWKISQMIKQVDLKKIKAVASNYSISLMLVQN